jgi:hypothetical protein
VRTDASVCDELSSAVDRLQSQLFDVGMLFQDFFFGDITYSVWLAISKTLCLAGTTSDAASLLLNRSHHNLPDTGTQCICLVLMK